jgi:hypothetical protein
MDMVEHGGQCCGIRTIFGFDHGTVAELDAHIARLDDMTNIGGVGATRMVEVVLSERQVTPGVWPRHLAERGFRLVSRFLNANSGRKCYVFHRANFLPLNDLPFTWDVNARATDNGVRPAATPIAPPVRFAIGQRVRYSNQGFAHIPTGTEGEVIAVAGTGNPVVRWDNGHTSSDRGHSQHYVEILAPAPVVRTVISTYHNVLRAGRSDAGWSTRAAAAGAAPRAVRIDRRDVRSDGNIVWTEGV